MKIVTVALRNKGSVSVITRDSQSELTHSFLDCSGIPLSHEFPSIKTNVQAAWVLWMVNISQSSNTFFLLYHEAMQEHASCSNFPTESSR